MTREEAIKELSYIADEMPSMECADWKEAISMAIKALEKEPRWVPVTERLPEEGYSVLVMRITDANYKYMRVATYQGDCWMDDTDKFNKPNPHKVIAWMTSPEPYKGGQEDGKA